MSVDRCTTATFAFALALLTAPPAHACRIGWDQHLFDFPPPHDVLVGAEIIHVRIIDGNVGNTERLAADPRGGFFPYSLIGMGRIVSKGISNGQPFPIYAFVTSCSGLRNGLAPPGDYFLIGRFAANVRGRAFYAGGRRVDSGGKDIYGGWHF